MILKIQESEGFWYSKISGDKNKIHTDKLTGYNSIFSEKICHGTLLVSKILKKNKFSKIITSNKTYSILFEFLDFIRYDINIFIKQQNKNKFFLLQDQKKKILINISKNKINLSNLKFKKKKFQINRKIKIIDSQYELIFRLLANISSYVGNKYPGKHSLIRSIKINFNRNQISSNKKILIYSHKLDKRFPIIKNVLFYGHYSIEFETLDRPFVKKNKFKISNKLRTKIQNYKTNILIIGASSGIGNDILRIFKTNKKILKIATYYKNNIKEKSKKILTYRINIFKDLNKIEKIIKLYSPIKIFYFPTTKILFYKKVNKKKLEEYNKIFKHLPLKIIKKNKKNIISFFYPSTSNINEDKNSAYSKVKYSADKLLKKFCKKNKVTYKSARFPALNSKQSVSLSNPNPKSFFEYINSSSENVDKVF